MSTQQQRVYDNLKALSDFNLLILPRADKVTTLKSHSVLSQFKDKTAALDETLLIIEDILAHGDKGIYSSNEIKQTFDTATSLENDINDLLEEMKKALKSNADYESIRFLSEMAKQPKLDETINPSPGVSSN